MADKSTEVTIIPPDRSAIVELVPIGTERPVTMIEADSDHRLVDLWLHGRAPRTQRAYSADALGFMLFVQKPLEFVTINDMQAYQAHLGHLATATQARRC